MIDPKLPLIDLHRHIEGCVRIGTILELGQQHNLPLPAWDVIDLSPHVRVNEKQPGVMAFIAKFKWPTAVMVDLEAVQRIAYENVLDLRAEGIHYAELRFSPWFMAEAHALDPAAVTEAVIDGVQAGSRDSGVTVNLIGILSRTYGPFIARQELQALLRHTRHLAALDLAGDEANFPGEMFVEHVHQARDAGLRITVHAGEAAGPQSIWQAIHQLGAERIGHAVHATADPVLLDYMAEHQIAIEANLTSNVQTSTVPNYASHPLRQFLQHGLCATINSDDPAISGINLRYEYEVAAPAAGLTREQIRLAQRNALQAAFLSDSDRRILAGRIH